MRLCIVILVLISFVLPEMAFGQKRVALFPKAKALPNKPLQSYAVLSVGDWELFINKDGKISYGDQYAAKGIFPKNTANLIYAQGIIWAGFLKQAETGEKIDSIPRVGGIYYDHSIQPGWIQNNGLPVDINDVRVKIYFIRKDWRSLSGKELQQEAAYYFDTDTTAVTSQMMLDLNDALAENWKNWPVDLGAPYNDVNGNGVYDPVLDANGYPDATKGDYPGVANADQVVWLVANDAIDQEYWGSPRIGLELQMTLWAYKGHFNFLSKTVFVRYRLINKSPYLIDSMYVGIFSDPDIGYYADDFVGCDTTRNLWFAYNAQRIDKEFERFALVPPALGYTFLAGPVVRSDDPDAEAWSDFKTKKGFRNLGLSSFTNLTNECYGGSYCSIAWYNYLRGYQATGTLKHPSPQFYASGPYAGKPTRFPLSGDPVSDPNGQYGDVDGAGNNMGPSDRRMSGNTGPFTLKPGESQEILLAISGGMGPDNRKAITDLRDISDLLSGLVKKNFGTLRFEPKPPDVHAASYVQGGNSAYVVLDWGWNLNRLKQTEEENVWPYKFEGYMIYQLPTPYASLSDPGVVKIATFDVKDNIFTISRWEYIPEYGSSIFVPFAKGLDSGIRRHIIIDKDYIHNKKLYKGFTYYFAVTAYNYNSRYPEMPGYESLPTVVRVTVEPLQPGERYQADLGDTLHVETNMKTDVICKAEVVDPTETTGHDYEIFFTEDTDTTSATYGQWLWNLKDKTINKLIISGQKIHKVQGRRYSNTPFEKTNEVLADGLALYVQAPKPGIKFILEVANRFGPFSPGQWDIIGTPYYGINVWHRLSAPNDLNRFYLSAAGDDGALSQIEQNIANAHSHDFEMRFTERGGIFTWWYDEGNVWAQVPFEFWDIGYATYQDTTDDVRCLTGGYSGGVTPGVFDYGYTDPYLQYPATDWISVRKPLNKRGSYAAYGQDVTSGTFTKDWWSNSVPILDNLIICDYSSANTLPETGTVIRFITFKGPQEYLKFWFSAPGRIKDDFELAKKDVEKINVFPNPYYAGMAKGPEGQVEYVTFTHLPEHAIIRIFTLSGDLVRKIEKHDQSPFCRWNLSNEKGISVASGLYIIRIEMPELKKVKVLKLMAVVGE